MLATALETNAEVPCWEMVTERLLYEETKIKQKEVNSSETKAMMTHCCGANKHVDPANDL